MTNSSVGFPQFYQIQQILDRFLAAHQDDAVAYQVIPVYVGSELVARGTHVLVQSINNPDQFHYNVWVFNSQSEVAIDYVSGSIR
ncbi:hypothetical protein FAM18110_02973 [Lacticaseibacillus paracasei]|jgi:hypothetical protein|nr:hypothetical protein [Lacticaseibacillus paracasei]RND42785.1 hypothetical protein FAM18110_02973 [Lacticaseibacillus paracasei]